MVSIDSSTKVLLPIGGERSSRSRRALHQIIDPLVGASTMAFYVGDQMDSGIERLMREGSRLVSVSEAPRLSSTGRVSQFDFGLLDRALEFVVDPEQLLATAYEMLSADAVLAVAVRDERGTSGHEAWNSRVAVRDDQPIRSFPGDSLSTLLFRNGFVGTRYHDIGAGMLLVVARRGAELPPTQRSHRLSVVLAAFNEHETFKTLLDEVLALKIDGVEIDVVVVESNSTDGTREDALTYVDHPRVNVVLEDEPRGKGHGVRTGLAVAEGDYILIQDADLEYEVADYVRVLEPLTSYQCGFVLGARERSHGAIGGVRHFSQATGLSFLMNVGNTVFLALFNVVYRQRLRDPFTMYKVFRRDCIDGVHLESNRFDFDWEIVAKLLRLGYEPIEVPVSYDSRSFTEGKKVSLLRDPLTWIRACLKYRFARIY